MIVAELRVVARMLGADAQPSTNTESTPHVDGPPPAIVDAPLTKQGESAPLTPETVDAKAGAEAITANGAPDSPALSEPVAVVDPVDTPVRAEPKVFLWNHKFYNMTTPGRPDFDTADVAAVEKRALRSVLTHILAEEPELDDFAITAYSARAVDSRLDADLLAMNPRAKWVIDIRGYDGTGKEREYPVVMNDTGTTYVDPRMGRF